MEHYNFKLAEIKWQKYWEKNNSFLFDINSLKEKYYMLVMLPYPSGDLHTGHLRNYTMGDIIARFKRMQGYNVLHPMGADAFGLPAENAAIKRKISPKIWTEQNVESFLKSMKNLGLSYDYSRFFMTCSEDYYSQQQKLFLKMYENDLVYQKESYVNWDPIDNTVLANEQVVDGRGWRSGAIVEKKKLKQWFFKITKYANELLDDIDDKLQEWTDKVKTMQKHWIGRSEGVVFDFDIVNSDKKIKVYSTRPDTLFGASFIALSFDHPIVNDLVKNNKELEDFIEESKKTSIDEETLSKMVKKGFDLKIKVKNPFDNSIELPVFVANFILMEYGTGAVFGCPAHDERDFEFAKKYNLSIKKVVNCNDEQLPFLEEGIAVNSNFLNDLNTKEAKQKAIEKLEKIANGERKTIFRMRDWSFSRQRYWGCPIPVVYCDKCGTVKEKEENLPIKLPEDVIIDGKGNPLDKHATWKYTKCPCCGGNAIRETDTMDTFVDSSWYFMRYVDLTKNTPFNSEVCNKVLPIDLYIGGAEHATMHLLYFRFFTKAFRDIGLLKIDEPCKKLYNQGLVCHKAYLSKNTKEYCFPWNVEEIEGKLYNSETKEELVCEGMVKMSKSKLNVVSNVKVVETYGADAARMFVLSDTPADKDFEWTEEGIESCWKYINRMYRLVSNAKIDFNLVNVDNYSNDILKITHKTIKDVENNINNIEFNKGIAKIRELTNFLEKVEIKTQEEKESYCFAISIFIKLFTPFAPHFCSEMAEILKIDNTLWPKYNESLTIDSNTTIAIQINGKLRGTLDVEKGLSNEIIEELAKEENNVKKYLEGKELKKIIIVADKLISFVV